MGKRMKLYIPGPIEVGEDVLEALSQPMMPHFGDDWSKEHFETIDLLKKVFKTNGEIYVIPGSGSAALDMGIGNLIYGDKSALVLSNGFFGARLAEIANGFCANVDTIDFGFANPFDVEIVKKKLKENHYDVLLTTHVETSVGIRNPIKELASLTKDSETIFFVDGVSSIGVEDIDLDSWGVDVCVTASQKGMESPPGLGIIAFNKKAWKLMESVNRPDWYLNFKIWKKYEEYWGPSHPQLVTQAIPIFRGMKAALKRIVDNGYEKHLNDYKEITKYFRDSLENLGYELYIKNGYSHGLTSVVIPDQRANEVMSYFKDNYQILIGGGLGDSKGKVVRVGHMGPFASKKDLDPIINIFKEIKQELFGAGS